MTFEEALRFGQDGEQIVGRYLMRRGFAIMPMYQFENHGSAPVVMWGGRAPIARQPSPDFMAWYESRQFFVEAKRKRRWVTFMGYPETGFNERLFRAYQQIKIQTGAPVWAFFLHEERGETGLFCQELATLEANS